MKVLIADDEGVTRRMLSGLLAQEGYDVVLTEDGTSALKTALNMKEPYVAIFDWMMPGLSGPQLCLCLRSPKLKIRPYLIVLSAKTDKGDVAAALDSGADDYLPKPFNPIELLARLRVAARTLQHQRDLQQQIAQLDIVVQRYNLLGEIVAQQGENRVAKPLVPEAAKPAPTAASAPTAQSAAPARHDLSPRESDAIMQRIIGELGFGNVGVIATVTGNIYAKSELIAWTGFILEGEQVWFDLLLEVDQAAMAMIFEQTMGRRPASEQERWNFLAETHTIVGAGIKTALANKGATVLTPVLSRVMRTKDHHLPPEAVRESHRYALAGGSIGLTIIRHECPLRKKSTASLQVTDIMAEAFPPPEINEVALLSKGAVLTERFIEKLTALDEVAEEKLAVPVYACSPLARYVLTEK